MQKKLMFRQFDSFQRWFSQVTLYSRICLSLVFSVFGFSDFQLCYRNRRLITSEKHGIVQNFLSLPVQPGVQLEVVGGKEFFEVSVRLSGRTNNTRFTTTIEPLKQASEWTTAKIGWRAAAPVCTYIACTYIYVYIYIYMYMYIYLCI